MARRPSTDALGARRFALVASVTTVALSTFSTVTAGCNSLVNRQGSTTIVDDSSDDPRDDGGGGGRTAPDARGEEDSASPPADSGGPDSNADAVSDATFTDSAPDSAADSGSLVDGARGADATDSAADGGVPAGTLQTIADDESQAEALTVAGNRVVWCNNGSEKLRSCDGDACAPIDISPLETTNSLATDGTQVFWGRFATGEILALPAVGATAGPTQLATGQSAPSNVERDGASLVWHTDADGGKIRACTIANCSATLHDVASSDRPVGIAAAAGEVYWHDAADALVHCPISGCTGAPTVLSSLASHSVQVVGGDAYFVTRSPVAVVRCPVSNCSAPTTLGTSHNPYQLTTDGRDVYWTNGIYRQLLHCPASGCGGAPDILYRGSSGGDVAAIALTNDFVYFSSSFEIRRVRR